MEELSGRGANEAAPEVDAAALRAAGWPDPAWDRYELVRPLGRGATGMVVEARDRRLGRHVALKFLAHADPAMRQRFLAEARAQARVEHPGICKVFEAGEVAGVAYIAMQLVTGGSLGEVAPGLTLEEKVLLLAEVADAVHEAHRTGLIHRDLKPANVMVERGEDGRLRPYVVDFGLARDTGGPGLTRTGFVVGTPAFMSPEQARGEGDRLDRRSDVYALGATLYDLLAGRPPFTGDDLVTLVLEIVDGDPPPLARFVPGLPTDLETIVRRCLEKEPARRYESARTLAEDLRRFLDGEPVLARRPSLAYRFGKRARKNRLVLAVAGAACLALAALGTSWLVERRQSEGRAAAAQRYGQEAERLEAFLWQEQSLPAHDVSPVRFAVRSRLAELEREAAGSATGSAAIRWALGRVHLALDEPRAARERLQAAWDAGFRSPEVAWALGLALVRIYQEELEAAAALPDRPARDARRRELAVELGAPARAALQASTGARFVPPEYIVALLAFAEERREAALAAAAAAVARRPALYEARLLAGDIHHAAATEHRGAGRLAAAREALARAGGEFRAAAEIARSDPRCLLRLARLHEEEMEIDGGRDPAAFTAAAVAAEAAARAAVAVDRGFAPAWIELAEILWAVGEYRLGHGGDPLPSLEEGTAAARTAVELLPGEWRAWLALGATLQIRSWVERDAGRDWRTPTGEAAESYRRALAVNPAGAPAWSNLAIAAAELAAAEQLAGREARPLLDESVAAAERAAALVPSSAHYRAQLANRYLNRGQLTFARGGDGRADVAAALASYATALEGNPRAPLPRSNLGEAHLVLAQAALDVGGEPGEELDRARAGFARAIAEHGNLALPRLGAGSTELVAARHRLARGERAEAELAAARRAFAGALAVDPGSLAARAGLAEAAQLEAEAALGAGTSPEGALAVARREASGLLAASPDDPDLLVLSGRVHLLAARMRGQEAEWRAAESVLARAAERAPGESGIWAALAELGRRRAEAERDPARAAAAVRTGRAAAAQALALHPGLAAALAEEKKLRSLPGAGEG